MINQGSTLQLECDVTGLPSPNITWLKDGGRVLPTQDGRVTFPAPSSLKVMFVTSADGGSYTCQAQNVAGTATQSVDVQVRGEEE